MRKGSLTMTDKITPINEADENESLDRSDLNVGGRSKNNKMLIIVAFLIVSISVLFAGIYFTFRNVTEVVAVEPKPENSNYIAGADKSRLDDSNDYFEQLRKEKARKEALEKDKVEKFEKAKKELEAEMKRAQERAAPVQRSTQPEPQVQRARVEQPEPAPYTSSRSRGNATPEQRKLTGDVLINIGGRSSFSEPEAPKSFSRSFNAFEFENGYANLRDKGSLDFMLIHGTSLPCALYTQIISDYEGFVTCRITQDVYSANGATLLVEKGSVVSGTQSVAMQQGKARIFTTWGDIETPLGVKIRIDSLGAGSLGAAGIDAWVDNHFAQRFGGAILLSFVDDALGALSEKLADQEGASFDNSTQNGSDMASKALDSSINIKPTGYAFIGQRINILVARDIDMSSVYRFGDGE